jgi:hypothetical protein
LLATAEAAPLLGRLRNGSMQAALGLRYDRPIGPGPDADLSGLGRDCFSPGHALLLRPTDAGVFWAAPESARTTNDPAINPAQGMSSVVCTNPITVNTVVGLPRTGAAVTPTVAEVQLLQRPSAVADGHRRLVPTILP